MSEIRSKIIDTAVAEATPLPYGKVSDYVRDGAGRRAGWERLKNYFDDGVQGWSEQHWQARGKILVGGGWVDISYLQGVQTPTYRVPQASKPSGVSWCGIFAAWVLRKSGLEDVRWVVGSGIKGNRVKQVAGNEGFSAGDVIVIKGGEVHHAIVSGIPDIYEGDGSLETINGNSDAQSIKIHSYYNPKQVWYYYKILD